MEILLKEPVPGDIGWLISTHGAIYSQQFHFDLGFEIDIARKVFSFYQQTDDFNVLFIAHVGDTRVGSIAVSRKPDNSAFVNFLVVLKEYRGKGVAKKLFDRVLDRSRKHGFERLRLETCSCLIVSVHGVRKALRWRVVTIRN